MKRLCRLIYRSSTSWDILTNELLRDLATGSAKRNAEHDITGILILSGETFLQVLEGAADAVNALYSRIIQDELHHDVILISYDQIASKSYDGWSMRVVDLNDLPGETRKVLRTKYDETDGIIEIPNDSPRAMALLFDARAYCMSEAD